jgi:predicted neutral ceramidase superfamily lipid hydrolase
MENKKWYLSKTIWVSLLIFVASLLVEMKIVNVELSPDAAWVGIAWSIIQLLLRLVTKEPVAVKTDAAGKILPLILIMLLFGCSTAKKETIVKDQTLTVQSNPIKAISIPGEYKNFTNEQMLQVNTAFENLPEDAVITAEATTAQGKVQSIFYPKKKPLTLLPIPYQKTQLSGIQYRKYLLKSPMVNLLC